MAPLRAQISPDNTLPTPSRVDTGCTRCTIDGGTVQGINLFHSFSEFSIPTGSEAIFNNPSHIENILSRVTGGSVSEIDGLIKANGRANLFFLNPNGIMFGPNSRLDIGGSFIASTADQWVFEDGSVFSAQNPEAPPLLALNVSPGIQGGTIRPQSTLSTAGRLEVGENLSLAAGQVNIQGTLYAGRNLSIYAENRAQLRDRPDSPLMLSAGHHLTLQGNQNLDIFAIHHPDSGLFSGSDMRLRSSNPVIGDAHYMSGGDVRVETLARRPGQLLSEYDPVIRAHGNVQFGTYTGASLHIFAGGSVRIGSITIDGADTTAGIQDTVTLSDGQTIVEIDGSDRLTLDIRAGTRVVGNPLRLDGQNSSTALNVGTSRSGIDTNARADIIIGSIDILAPDGLILLTNAYQPNGSSEGNIRVRAIQTGDGFGGQLTGMTEEVILDSRNNIILSGGGIGTLAPTGHARHITFMAENLVSLKNGTAVIGATFGGAPGGNIDIHTRRLRIIDGSFVGTGTFGAGPSGDIVINASESIVAIAGENEGGILNRAFATGDAGSITIRTTHLTLRDGAQITASTNGAGAGGQLRVHASESIDLVGVLADPTVTSGLFASSRGAGDAGNLRIETQRFVARDGGQVGAFTTGTGDAGNIRIVATESVELLRTPPDAPFDTGVFSQTFGAGDGGHLSVETQRLIIRDGANLSSGVFFLPALTEAEQESLQLSGRPGNISIVAPERIEVVGIVGNRSSTINSITEGMRRGGRLTLETGSLIVSNGGFISASNFNEGGGGRVIISASDSIHVIGRPSDDQIETGIFSNTTVDSVGEAGDVLLRAPFITVSGNNATISVGNQGNGAGGDLHIEADNLTLERRGLISAETQSDRGGNIIFNIDQVLLLQGGGQISTNAGNAESGGDGGDITINLDNGFVIAVPGDDSDITANAFEGRGGNVRITAQGIFGIEPRANETELNDITASSEFGINGVIELNALDADPIENTAVLPSVLIDASQLVAQGCTSPGQYPQTPQGAFVDIGRGGMISSPTGALNSSDIAQDLQIPSTWNMELADVREAPFVEAHGWIENAEGIMMLVADLPVTSTALGCWQ